jgi:ABC-type nitrate/sulfonate/bicarbonate transport system substrate-binding protein
LDALRNGQIAASLLNGTFVSDALSRGYSRLLDSVEVIGAYQGSVIGASRSWVRAHPKETVAFLRALLRAIGRIYDPTTRMASAESLARRFPGMSLNAASVSVEQLVSGPARLTNDGALNQEGISTVLRLRNKYGMPRRELTDSSKYVDLSYYEAARANKEARP